MKNKIIPKKLKGKGGIYFLPPVGNTLKSYLSYLKIPSVVFWQQLDINLVKKVFLLSLRDFYQKKINLDQLSSIALRLYYNDKFWTPFEIDSKDVELGTILGYAEEVSHYRHLYKETKNIKDKKSHDLFLEEIKEYYIKNKHIRT